MESKPAATRSVSAARLVFQGKKMFAPEEREQFGFNFGWFESCFGPHGRARGRILPVVGVRGNAVTT